MSSLLNVSNNSSNSEEINPKDINVLVNNKGRIGLKLAYTGQYLGIARIITSTTKLSEEDIRSWTFLQAEGDL